jgi:regulator of RNase E activity RraA
MTAISTTQPEPHKTLDLPAIRQTLYTAVLSDVLDHFGYRDQALPSFIRPLDDTLKLVGYARTGLFMPAYQVLDGENPYEFEIALIDDLGDDDIVVLACDGPTERLVPWGELLTTASLRRGAVGCLTDGMVRDVRQIRDLRFPVFHGGIGPLDSRGRGKMMGYDVPVECGGVAISSGDLIFGDVDGVVVIPRAVAGDVVDAAFAKVNGENVTREEIESGALLSEVYAKYGIL